jgi:hypothetical protein
MVEQVGGRHYEAAAPGKQHCDLMEAHDVDYLTATATKYITRYDRKGSPAEDLAKAKSYVDRALQEQRGARRRVPLSALDTFYDANGLEPWKRMIINLLLAQGCGAELDFVSVSALLAHRVAELQLNDGSGIR